MRAILLILSCVSLLAGCAATASPCDVLSRPPRPNDARRMVLEERPVSEYLVETGKTGRKLGCWK